MTINTISYDTQTGTHVASVAHVEGNVLRQSAEHLYRGINGNWFLHGEGGPSTEYAKHHADCIKAGERITPLTENEALDWCELNQAQDVIDQYFGHLTQDA